MPNRKIYKIRAEEIFDSRGNPTLQVFVQAGNTEGDFSVPSGASRGAYEAHELRDGDKDRFGGLGVRKAIRKIEEKISPALIGLDITDQSKIDSIMLELDGTEHKTNLGGNSIVGVSIACAKAAAKLAGKEVFEYLRGLENIAPSRDMPLMYINLINGGKHSKSKLSFQEYLVIPMADGVEESFQIGGGVQDALGDIMSEKYNHIPELLGDEGGYILDTDDVMEPLKILGEATQKSGYEERVNFAMDVAASSFYKEGKYMVGDKYLGIEEMLALYNSMIRNMPLFSIEDPFFEEDFASFAELKKSHEELMVVGDDLTTTNGGRLARAIEEESVGAIIIKPNQIGTLSETLQTMRLARENGIHCIVSHRSGETKDDFIADLAYAFGCFGLKAGALRQDERLAKYNRLKKIAK